MTFSRCIVPQDRQGHVAILLAAFLWGTTGTVATFAPQINPLAIGAFAMGIGGLLQALVAARKLKQDLPRLLELKKILLVGTMAIVVYPLAFYSSMRFAGVAIGTVISIATAPFMAAGLECLFGKKSAITSRWLSSAALGVMGIALLAYAEPAVVDNERQDALKYLGILLGCVAGFTYALYSWVAKTVIEAGVQSESAMGSLFGLGAVFLIPSLLFTGEHLFSSVTHVAVACYMALVPMFIGYLAFGFGLRSVPASHATLLTLFEPVVAALLAVWIVGEVITLPGWVGVTFIAVCLVLQTQGPSRMTAVSTHSPQKRN